MVRRLLKVLLGLFVLFLVLLVGGGLYFDRKIRVLPRRGIEAYGEAARAHADATCAELTAISAHPFFHPVALPDADAGPLLNAWLPWEGGEGDARKELSARTAKLHLPLPVELQLKEWGADWTTRRALTPEMARLDFAWLAELRKYGHWNLIPGGPLEQLDPYDPRTQPIPEYVLFQKWAKLRWVDARARGDEAQASAELQHLAWLSFSSENLLGTVIATSLLGIERRVYDEAAKAGPVPAGWKPVDAETLDRLTRFRQSGHLFFNLAVAPEVTERLSRCGSPNLWRCQAVTDQVVVSGTIRPYVEELYRDRFEWLDRTVAAGEGCRFEVARATVEHYRHSTATGEGKGMMDVAKAAELLRGYGPPGVLNRALGGPLRGYLLHRMGELFIGTSLRPTKDFDALLTPAKPVTPPAQVRKPPE